VFIVFVYFCTAFAWRNNIHVAVRGSHTDVQ